MEVEGDKGGGEDEEEYRVDATVDSALEERVGFGESRRIVVATLARNVGQTIAMGSALRLEDGKQELAVGGHALALGAPCGGAQGKAPGLRRGVNEYVVGREEGRAPIFAKAARTIRSFFLPGYRAMPRPIR